MKIQAYSHGADFENHKQNRKEGKEGEREGGRKEEGVEKEGKGQGGRGKGERRIKQFLMDPRSSEKFFVR